GPAVLHAETPTARATVQRTHRLVHALGRVGISFDPAGVGMLRPATPVPPARAGIHPNRLRSAPTAPGVLPDGVAVDGESGPLIGGLPMRGRRKTGHKDEGRGNNEGTYV